MGNFSKRRLYQASFIFIPMIALAMTFALRKTATEFPRGDTTPQVIISKAIINRSKQNIKPIKEKPDSWAAALKFTLHIGYKHKAPVWWGNATNISFERIEIIDDLQRKYKPISVFQGPTQYDNQTQQYVAKVECLMAEKLLNRQLQHFKAKMIVESELLPVTILQSAVVSSQISLNVS